MIFRLIEFYVELHRNFIIDDKIKSNTFSQLSPRKESHLVWRPTNVSYITGHFFNDFSLNHKVLFGKTCGLKEPQSMLAQNASRGHLKLLGKRDKKKLNTLL